MDKMEEAPGLPVTRSQPWPAPTPGSQVTSNNGAKPGASFTHLLAGAGLNGNNITMVSDQREREDYWLLTILGVCSERGHPAGEFLQTIQLPLSASLGD